ncbi:MAG: PilZ domain-containing protein [Deltaproteobacteria bacterium]|nr:PilZ domain-containing protein [Deltaproteobacteria bacterium]MDH3929517.1 PilZ domain-containing protein [Deltaproteobacteria bacterium]
MDYEKRIYPRIEIKWPVSAITVKGMMQGETKNISLNGAFICCEKALCPDEVLLLTVKGPSGSIQVVAQVVWSNRCAFDEQKSPSAIGVKFMWSLPKTESECMIWSKAS